MCKKIIANKGILALILIIAVLIIDQTIKIAVKTSMSIGESIRITNWFYIYFIENNGMAYGVTLVNKLFLSVLRVIAVTVIGWYICQVIKEKGRFLYVILLSMIFAGAVGNILDSMFYGLIFSSSTPFNISTIVDFGTGYSGFLMGKVVDMFYFPIIHTTWPAWFPFVGGNEFIFFSPIFNFADASVTTGIICLFLFCTKDMGTIGDTFSNAIKRYKNR
ncbi:MAG: lipoprotein signal peptidase [Prevotellaceae bacterium]|nr:lipoprotein signal peptidase [Prevotellaceae bacterium]MBF1074184.1 lipoprotein signal peptidase [Prevotellaceae bacterium]